METNIDVETYDMEPIINLTQHLATEEQLQAGVVDLSGEKREKLQRFLNFDRIPSELEINWRADQIVNLLEGEKEYHCQVMIGGALWLMGPLTRKLKAERYIPVYAFSVRESEEEILPDGSVRKVNIFKHKGFIPAL